MKYAVGIAIAVCLLFSICQSSENEAHQVTKIIFDTDMGSDCDDVGALALLHHYANEGKVELLGCIFSSGRVPYGAGVIDAINKYYDRRNIPVGACHQECIGDPKDKMLAEKLAKDTRLYGNKIIDNHDAAEQTRLNRKLLISQADGSVTYLTVGHTQGLHALLTSQSDDVSPLTGKELVEQKVKRWVALGALDANNRESQFRQDWNFYRNGTKPFTEYLVRNFPNDIYFINAGAHVMTGASLENEPKGTIVRDAYETWLWNTQQKKLFDQRPSWDLATVYFAVEGLGDFLQMEESGWLEFDQKKGARWIKSEHPDHANHFYVNQKPEVDAVFGEYLNNRIIK